jgi:hypothetical protein
LLFAALLELRMSAIEVEADEGGALLDFSW